jgi:hypothetical protein
MISGVLPRAVVRKGPITTAACSYAVTSPGRTSAPIRPQAVQTILGHKERTGISSGRASAFMTAL